MKFNYAFDIKEPLSVYKSLKGHITISHDTFQNPNELLYKIFIYTSEDKKALISQDWGKFKNPYVIKIKDTLKNVTNITITEKIQIYVEIWDGEKIISKQKSDHYTLSAEKFEKLLKFVNLYTYCPNILPNTDLIFWIVYKTKFPMEMKFKVAANMYSKNALLTSQTYHMNIDKDLLEKRKKERQKKDIDEELKINTEISSFSKKKRPKFPSAKPKLKPQSSSSVGTYQDKGDQKLVIKESKSFSIIPHGGKLSSFFYYPFSLRIPDFQDKKLKANLEVLVFDEANTEPSKDNCIFSREIKLEGLGELRGFGIKHLGFNRDLKVGELGTMLLHINNKNPGEIRGKAIVEFISLKSKNPLPIFKRKFKIFPDNYEKMNEDISPPASLAGNLYWIRAKLKVKSSYGKFKLEGLSQPRICGGPKRESTFHCKLRAEMRDGLHFGAKVIIRADSRIDPLDIGEYKTNSIKFQIIETFDNRNSKILYNTRIKKWDISHHQVEWEVPKQRGSVVLSVRFYLNDVLVSDENIEKNDLQYNIINKT